MLEIEVLDQLLAREDLLVAVGPAEPGQIVDHGLGQDARVAEGLDRGGAVALGQAAPVRAQDHRDVGELGERVAERLVAEDLLGGVREVVVAADHVADPHRDVVDHDAEVIGWPAVRAHQDPVVELGVVEGHGAVDQVLDDGLALRGYPQAEGALGEPPVAAAPRVAKGLAPPLGGLALGLELRGRAVAVVGPALGQEAPGVGPVNVQPLGLPVAGCRRPLVPVEVEPAQRLEDRLDRLLRRPVPVGVLDAEDEDAAVMPGEEPVEEGGARAPHVEVAGRARRESDPDRVGHGQYVSKSRPQGVRENARIRAAPTVGYQSRSW